jgi:hypothetical protein
MIEPVSSEELEKLLEPETGQKPAADIVGWPLVIDYQTFCSRLAGYGFNEINLARAKAALIEAELAYRYLGRIGV